MYALQGIIQTKDLSLRSVKSLTVDGVMLSKPVFD